MAAMAEAATADERKKALEMRQFQRVVATWPGAFPTPVGDIEQPMEPAADIRFRLSDGSRYSVEITQLLRPEGKELASARGKLLAALDPRLALLLPGVRVALSFTDRPLPRLPEAVERIECLLRAYAGSIRVNIVIRNGLPDFLSHVQLCPSDRASVSPGGSFSVSALNKDQVSDCIGQKHRRIHGYRAHADAVALLIYCPMASSLAQVGVPADLASWSFEHHFERVVLYADDSNGEGMIWQ